MNSECYSKRGRIVPVKESVRQTDGQTDTHTQADRQTDTHTYTHNLTLISPISCPVMFLGTFDVFITRNGMCGEKEEKR